MILFLRKYVLLFLMFGFLMMNSQEPETIRVRKESNLAKAFFDVTELKLIPFDRFGNPQDNKIMGFKLFVKTKRNTKVFESFSNTLSNEMTTYLNGLKTASKIFFTDIMVEENDRRLLKLPDVIDVWFPTCVNSEKNKKRK